MPSMMDESIGPSEYQNFPIPLSVPTRYSSNRACVVRRLERPAVFACGALHMSTPITRTHSTSLPAGQRFFLPPRMLRWPQPRNQKICQLMCIKSGGCSCCSFADSRIDCPAWSVVVWPCAMHGHAWQAQRATYASHSHPELPHDEIRTVSVSGEYVFSHVIPALNHYPNLRQTLVAMLIACGRTPDYACGQRRSSITCGSVASGRRFG